MTPADAASMCDAQVERLDEAGPERSSFGLERRAEQRLGVAAAMMSSPEPRPAIRFDRIDQIKPTPLAPVVHDRSEEHTSELQSLMRISYAVFCLKKKKYYTRQRE